MIKAEQVPDEVVDVAVAMRDRGGSMRDIIRTAINAWPGMVDGSTWQTRRRDIILPLDTENIDD